MSDRKRGLEAEAPVEAEVPAVGAPVPAGPSTVNNITKNTIYNYFAPVSNYQAPTTSTSTQTESAPPPKKQKKEDRTHLRGSTLACKLLPKAETHLDFVDFLEECIEDVGGACFAYHSKGSPIAEKGQKLRGTIAEKVAIRMFEKRGYDVSMPPSDELRVNGAKRGETQSTHDFVIKEGGEEKRMEVKNSRMVYTPGDQTWKLNFKNVKKENHDSLVLSFEGYDSLRFYKWDGMTGYSTTGKSEESTGGQVAICASWHQPSFEDAHKQLVYKMRSNFEFLGKVSFTRPSYNDIFSMSTIGEDAYEGAPLASLSGCARGKALERLVRCVLEKTGEKTEEAEGGRDCSGCKLGKDKTTSDFKVGGKRGEAKSSIMGWNKHMRRFEIKFCNVKSSLHDRLFLAFMTPSCVHIFEYYGERGKIKNGVSTEAKGETIMFRARSGKKGAKTWKEAEKDILRKIKFYGGKKTKYVAKVAFGEGDAERVMEIGAEKGNFGGDEE